MSRPTLHPEPILPLQIQLKIVTDPKHLLITSHHHMYHEFLYVLGGQGSFKIRGHEYALEHGDLIYTARGLAHARDCSAADPTQILVLTIDSLPFETLLAEGRRRLGADPVLPYWFCWSPEMLAGQELVGFLKTLRRWSKDDVYWSVTRRRMLADWLVQLFATVRPPERPGVHAIAALARRIREHPDQVYKLSEEAARAQMSPAWLSRSFKAQLGVGFVEYRDLSRIDRSLGLLLEGQGVHDVARAVGFRSTAQFITTFKRAMACTPHQFRRRRRR